MKTRPIQPARIDFGTAPGDPPRAPDFDDIYHPRAGAQLQARHVFLHGNGLPGRWAGRADFTVLETGFGLGHNFLALWDAWRQDPQRCDRLHVVAVDLHPPGAADLACAHAGSPLPDLAAELLAQWPPLTPNLHQLHFSGGRVRLTLALGDVVQLLPALRLQADAIFLDGFAPVRNPAMWSQSLLKTVGRLSAPDATAASWSVDHELQRHLVTAGFEPSMAPGTGGKSDFTCARFVPRTNVRGLPATAVHSADAVVVGAGLAGAAVARALAERGLRVTVLEQAGAAATAASGNPAGLFHGTLGADDGPYARLYRTAALLATRCYREAVAAGVPGQVAGLLRLATPQAGDRDTKDVMRETGLTPDYVQWLESSAASDRAGLALQEPCWFYPGGGWVSPPAWVQHALAHPAISLRTGIAASVLRRQGDTWYCLDAQGALLAQSRLLVLANASGAAPLLRPLGHPGWPLQRSRGQITHWRTDGPTGLQLPLVGDGYAIAMPGTLLCGATRQEDDEEPRLREQDHQQNIDRFRRLTGLPGPAAGIACEGRVGWRLAADDRLPIAGAVPLLGQPVTTTQTRLLSREVGLFVLSALGARGLTLAPLMGDLVASQATGTPWPVEQDLADAVDPGRWLVRQARLAT